MASTPTHALATQPTLRLMYLMRGCPSRSLEQMLLHASTCVDCSNSSCAQMKGLFSHAMSCRNKPPAGNCRACWHMWALLNSHASHCTARECPVPECLNIRERNRQRATRREDARRAAYRAMLQAQRAS